MRSRLVLALAAGVAAVSLAGCGAQSQEPQQEDATAGAGDCTASGDASDSVEVTGELGGKPEVAIEAPLEFAETQRTVVIEGAGEEPGAADSVLVELTIYDATTGDEIRSTGFDGTGTVDIPLDGSWPGPPGFVKAVACASVGTRVLSALTPEDGYGAQGNPNLGIAADVPLVVVADLVSITEPPLSRADGEPQALPADFPAIEVELSVDGAPTMTLPDEKPPSKLTIGVLKKGNGDDVKPGSNVTVNYQGMIWDKQTVFDDSWAGGKPVTFNTAGVVPGFRDMLEGQTVGSQVIAVLPPDAGYGEAGNPGAGIEGDDTLVFVVDILATD